MQDLVAYEQLDITDTVFISELFGVIYARKLELSTI